jgi:hypothetical protein
MKGAGETWSQFAVFVEKIKIFHQNKLPDLILVVRGGLVKVGLLCVGCLQIVLDRQPPGLLQAAEQIPIIAV